MYTKDLTRRITLRLDLRLAVLVRDGADKLGITPSDFVRRVLWANLASTEKAVNDEDKAVNINHNIQYSPLDG